MGAVKGRATRIVAALGLLAIGLVYTQAFLSASSSATPVAGWSSPVLVDSATSGSLSTFGTDAEEGGVPAAVSCASSSFCAMVDTAGNAATYDGTAWSAPQRLNDAVWQYLTGISCPSATFCMAADVMGDTYSYNGTTWSSAGTLPFPFDNSRISLSCPTTQFCLAANYLGGASMFNGTSWSAIQHVTSGIRAVTCVSSTFCMAVTSGDEVDIYDQAATPAWKVDSLLNAPSPQVSTATTLSSGWGLDTGIGNADRPLSSVSCVSTTFCVVADNAGNAFVYKGGTNTWLGVAGGPDAAGGISCATTTFCFYADTSGNVTLFDGSGWSTPASIGAMNGAAGISCISGPFCMLVDEGGYAQSFTGASAPTVSTVDPANGPVTGGTAVTITGTNFISPVTVHFGSQAASAVTVDSSTSISATSPADSLGSVDVTVTTASGTSPTSAADQFVYSDIVGAFVTSVNPTQGPQAGGTPVSISGLNFTGATDVHFGVNEASFTVNSSTSISATSPAGTGTVDISVTTPSGTSATTSADQFTYVVRPMITGINPETCVPPGGATITITGTAFVSPAIVAFGLTHATAVDVNSPTSITTTAPAGTGTVAVTVTTAGGTSPLTAADLITYCGPPPSITPHSGPTIGGTVITITGSGFTGATAVDFGMNEAETFTVNSDSQITAVSPAGTGTVDVTVATPLGTTATSSADQFTYVPPPSVTSVSPGHVCVSTFVTITGANLTGAIAVDFGGTPASSFVVNSDTTIWVVPPTSITGLVDVTVTTAGGVSALSDADQFSYTACAPITSVSPTGGPIAGGTVVTITGTGFTSAAAVDFDGIPAQSFTVSSDDSITATSPQAPCVVPGVVPGTASDVYCVVDVTVTTPSGSLSSNPPSFPFTYLLPTSVSSVDPNSGTTAGHTLVTIAGSGFNGTTAVHFGASLAETYTVNSDTSISATSPPGTGTVNVTVTTPAGTSAQIPADHFTYVTPPPPPSHGYWLVGGDGGIFTFGDARFFGSTGGLNLQRPVVGMTPTADRGGYWMVASDGGMFAFGDAKYHGSIPGLGIAPAGSGAAKELAAPIVAMVASPTGRGYLLVASDGGVFAFGDALYRGSCPAIGGCNGSVVAVVPDTGELGYWVVTSTGSVYPFGNAAQVTTGQPGATAAPVTAAAASPTGRGYFVVDALGDVYAYGDAHSYGSPPSTTVPSPDIVGIVPTSSGAGYWLMGADGAVYPRGDAPADGSMASKHLNAAIVTAAGF